METKIKSIKLHDKASKAWDVITAHAWALLGLKEQKVAGLKQQARQICAKQLQASGTAMLHSSEFAANQLTMICT